MNIAEKIRISEIDIQINNLDQELTTIMEKAKSISSQIYSLKKEKELITTRDNNKSSRYYR